MTIDLDQSSCKMPLLLIYRIVSSFTTGLRAHLLFIGELQVCSCLIRLYLLLENVVCLRQYAIFELLFINVPIGHVKGSISLGFRVLHDAVTRLSETLMLSFHPCYTNGITTQIKYVLPQLWVIVYPPSRSREVDRS